MNQPNGDLRTALAKTKDVRAFLKSYFEITGLPYAEIARRAGFSSRSYPRDVTEGRRRLTLKAMPKLLRGLRIDKELENYFRALFFVEFPDESPTLLSRPQLIQQARKIQERLIRAPIRSRIASEAWKKSKGSLSQIGGATFEVIAALGENDVGATLEEIKIRTGIPSGELTYILEKLMKTSLIRYAGDQRRYFPAAAHLDLSGLPQDDIVKSAFLSASRKALASAEASFSKKDALFFTSSISVKKESIPELRAELKKVLLRYVDKTIEQHAAQPDSVINLACSLLEARNT